MINGSTAAPLQHAWFEDNIRGTPLTAFISGTFSVAIFFVLSGFVLSVGFFQSRKLAIVRKLAVKRYLRLMLPALVSVLIAYMFIKLNLYQGSAARLITQSSALPAEWVHNPNLIQALHEGLAGIFLQGPVDNYNSVLWTMKYEFIGSFIIFAFLMLFGKSSKRWLIHAVLVAALYSTWYLGLVLGMILADLFVHRRVVFENFKQGYYYLLLGSGIVMGAYPGATSAGTMYDHLNFQWLTYEQNQAIYTIFGAVCVVVAVLNIKFLKLFMASKVMSKIGSYTYSLYLVHQPLVYIVGVGLFMVLSRHFGYNRSVFLSFGLTIPVVILATLLFYRIIELPSMRVAAYFEEVYSGRREINFQLLKEKFSTIRTQVWLSGAYLRHVWSTRFSYNDIETEEL